MNIRMISIVLLCSIFFSSCSGGQSQTRGLVNERNSQATYSLMDCPFEVPEGMQVSAACGLLEVPETRGASGGPVQADSKTVKMAAAVVKARAETPRPDPVLVLFMDPSPELDWSWVLGYFFEELNAERDLIAVDLRGMGASQPAFNCPEFTDLYFNTLDQDGFSAAVQEQYNLSLAQCYQRWMDADVDLAAFSTDTFIADLEELRITLGYQQWNILAAGYGATLALGLLRDYPKSVRSVMMDSFEPQTAEHFLMMAKNEQRILEQFFARCEQDTACSEVFPDFKHAFFRLVDDLNSAPKLLEVPDLESGERRNVLLTGYLFLQYSIVSVGINHPVLVSTLPRAVSQASKGNYKDIVDMISNLMPMMGPSQAVGVNNILACAEDMPLVPPERFAQSIRDFEEPWHGYYDRIAANQESACQVLETLKPASREWKPVESNVPTLVLALHNNPWTAPEWANEMSSKLSRATLVEYYGEGSTGWLMNRNTCPHQLATAFIQDPEATLDTTCAKQEPKIMWVTMQQ